MSSVRITSQTHVDTTWHHTTSRRLRLQPRTLPHRPASRLPTLPRPRRGSPSRDPRPPTGNAHLSVPSRTSARDG
ncbi:hypothetical protein Lesp01_28390 [Lentzea sp. NBRC 102530]|nr:hypothetical protein Lesp01_28390 [Lentzea sp. NBRC 102530]